MVQGMALFFEITYGRNGTVALFISTSERFVALLFSMDHQYLQVARSMYTLNSVDLDIRGR